MTLKIHYPKVYLDNIKNDYILTAQEQKNSYITDKDTPEECQCKSIQHSKQLDEVVLGKQKLNKLSNPYRPVAQCYVEQLTKSLPRKRSHGKRHYNKITPQPDATTSTLVDLVDMIEKPEGVHNINTKLFSISFPQLCSLQKLALESTNFDYSSAEYRVIAIILDIANYRLFRPVRSDVPAEKPKHFMKIKFLNKAVDAINLPALL